MENIIIRYAKPEDADIIAAYDKWINRDVLIKKITDNEVYVAFDGDEFAGWLRYGLFWDNTPFMNMLHLPEAYRGKGIGSRFVAFWEDEMSKKGHKVLMTSTAQTEYSQHFYDKLGYKAIGSFIMEDEPLEIIFVKFIRS